MEVTCERCGATHTIEPPPWVISTGKPFRLRCAACGHRQMVRPPTGIAIVDAPAPASTPPDAPSAEPIAAASSTDHAPASPADPTPALDDEPLDATPAVGGAVHDALPDAEATPSPDDAAPAGASAIHAPEDEPPTVAEAAVTLDDTSEPATDSPAEPDTDSPAEPARDASPAPEPGPLDDAQLLPEPAHEDLDLPEHAHEDLDLPEHAHEDLDLPEHAHEDLDLPEHAHEDLDLPERADEELDIPGHPDDSLVLPDEAAADLHIPEHAEEELQIPVQAAEDLETPDAHRSDDAPEAFDLPDLGEDPYATPHPPGADLSPSDPPPTTAPTAAPELEPEAHEAPPEAPPQPTPPLDPLADDVDAGGVVVEPTAEAPVVNDALGGADAGPLPDIPPPRSSGRYVLHQSGQFFNVADADTLSLWVRQRRIARTDAVSERGAPWQRAEDVDGMAALFRVTELASKGTLAPRPGQQASFDEDSWMHNDAARRTRRTPMLIFIALAFGVLAGGYYISQPSGPGAGSPQPSVSLGEQGGPGGEPLYADGADPADVADGGVEAPAPTEETPATEGGAAASSAGEAASPEDDDGSAEAATPPPEPAPAAQDPGATPAPPAEAPRPAPAPKAAPAPAPKAIPAPAPKATPAPAPPSDPAPPAPKPATPQASIDAAWDLVNAQKFAAAESAFRDVLRTSPGNASAAYGLGYVLIQRGDRDGAKQQLCAVRNRLTGFEAKEVAGVLSTNNLTCP